VGAGLTYWFVALNRRHQEAREDRTRWYEPKLNAYVEYIRAIIDAIMALRSGKRTVKEGRNIADRCVNSMSMVMMLAPRRGKD
jgi:hypothetical protein